MLYKKITPDLNQELLKFKHLYIKLELNLQLHQ
jgi:hypothetical protein